MFSIKLNSNSLRIINENADEVWCLVILKMSGILLKTGFKQWFFELRINNFFPPHLTPFHFFFLVAWIGISHIYHSENKCGHFFGSLLSSNFRLYSGDICYFCTHWSLQGWNLAKENPLRPRILLRVFSTYYYLYSKSTQIITCSNPLFSS